MMLRGRPLRISSGQCPSVPFIPLGLSRGRRRRDRRERNVQRAEGMSRGKTDSQGSSSLGHLLLTSRTSQESEYGEKSGLREALAPTAH